MSPAAVISRRRLRSPSMNRTWYQMPITSITTPSNSSEKPKLRGVVLPCCNKLPWSFWKNWKIVNPKPISESDVRITDISVRSALIRVRWNDMPVRRDESSVLIFGSGDFDVIGSWTTCCMATSPRAAALVFFVLSLAPLRHVAPQEEFEERPNHRDRTEPPDRLPARADRCLDDV